MRRIRVRRYAHYDDETPRKESLVKVARIASHPETKVVRLEDFPQACDYVCGMFPGIAGGLRSAKVYKNENTAFCAKIGVPPGAAGLFFIHVSTILICWGRSHTDDVILVHELLHYASRLMGSHQHNSKMEEDFAYSKSIKYLARDHDEEWIRDKYLFPYYREMTETDEEAKAKCQSIIDSEMGKPAKSSEGPADRFDLL